MTSLGNCPSVLFGAAVITALIGRVVGRDLHLFTYVLLIAGVIALAIQLLGQERRRARDASERGQGDDANTDAAWSTDADLGPHGHHDWFDGGHGGDGGH